MESGAQSKIRSQKKYSRAVKIPANHSLYSRMPSCKVTPVKNTPKKVSPKAARRLITKIMPYKFPLTLTETRFMTARWRC